MGSGTTKSRGHPAAAPTQLWRGVIGRPGRGGLLRAWVSGPVPVRTVVVMSGSFKLALAAAAPAEAAQQQGEAETDQDEDDRDHARRSHQVGSEAADVHVQGEDPGGVAGAAGGEHEDEVEERQ